MNNVWNGILCKVLACESNNTAMYTAAPHINIKTFFPRYGDSHIKDKTVFKMGILYW